MYKKNVSITIMSNDTGDKKRHELNNNGERIIITFTI